MHHQEHTKQRKPKGNLSGIGPQQSPQEHEHNTKKDLHD
jgi:hypothetical protein